MTKRYFKATDGKITVFRSSETRDYRAASFITKADGSVSVGSISFSARSGSYETKAIPQAEYERLVGLKTARCKVAGRDGSSPQNSWIYNTSLTA